jgi:ABC-type polar amino acid transport system ATPase subunit
LGEVLSVMKALAEKGMTMIVVTHEMSFAKNVADRVLFFDGGIIRLQGDPKTVFDDTEDARLLAFLGKKTPA